VSVERAFADTNLFLRFLTDDVPAGGQDPLHLGVVELVGGGDVDGVDLAIVQQRVQARVGLREADPAGGVLAAIRAAPEHAAHRHPQPAQVLDVHGADEAAADDGRADVAEARHGSLLRRRGRGPGRLQEPSRRLDGSTPW